MKWQKLWAVESGDRYCWVVDVRPTDVPFDSGRAAYVRDLDDDRALQDSPTGKRKARARARSVYRVRRLGLRSAAEAYYGLRGWPRAPLQLHHLDGVDAGEGEPERWALLPRAVHLWVHGKTVRKSHPLHPSYGRKTGVSLGRREAARRSAYV